MISKQNNVIEADVTRLVEKVQREKLLFYPLIIHLLFWLYPFKYEENKIILPIVAEGEIDAAFFKVCKCYLESGTDLS